MNAQTVPAITGILECLNSKRDRAGNCYFAFVYTDNATGKSVRGTVCGGESNVRQIMYELNGGSWEPRTVHYTASELPIREFERLTKGWPHAGCVGAELVAFIRRQLAA